MSSAAAREHYLHKRTQIINNFCHTYGISVNPLNHGYQLRVENLVDLYPVNGRYCILQTGERGDWDSGNDLRRLMLRALPRKMPHIEVSRGVHDYSPASGGYMSRPPFWRPFKRRWFDRIMKASKNA